VSEAIDRIATSLAHMDTRRDTAVLRPSIRRILSPKVIFARTSDVVGRACQERIVC
jgi:hypothetical protein